MYSRILLAYDGTLEGRTALREGALLAHASRAKVFLLSVVAESTGLMLAEGANVGVLSQEEEIYQTILDEGVQRMRKLGFAPEARLAVGEPVVVIGQYAREINADLVVIGHRKQSFLQRWWTGSIGAHLLDHTACSVLISRNTISEQEFETRFKAVEAGG